jgi:hypothetical protein
MEVHTWQGFFDAVVGMREVQKRYFKTKSQTALTDAKACEKVVDEIIQDRVSRIRKSAEPELFDQEENA